jgi:hypothetical protein
MLSFSRSGPPFLRLELPSSASVWRGKRPRADSSKSAPHSRGAQATLKQRDEEVSRLDGELNQLSVSHEDLCQSLEEQEATVLSLRQAAEDTRKALEAEKKQIKGESLFACLSLVGSTCLGSAPNFVFSFMVSGLRTALRNSTTQA